MNKSNGSWFEAYDYYERRFFQAMVDMPMRYPWKTNHKAEITRWTKESLGIRDEWIPTIRTELVRTVQQQGFSIQFLTFSSWENVYGTAHLYVPDQVTSSKKELPFVLLCCGHGSHGKLNIGYQAAARRLAQQGTYVLIPDLIGQGERQFMGHAKAVHPFACGISVQGLLVMEALAWVNWSLSDSRFDTARLAAIGNSGGGTLTCFLAVLCDHLAVICSSGYPSTFEFIARCKERLLCSCNIIPGIVGQLEMWQLYGMFAPKPLFLFQGDQDRLFPKDLFYQVMRKVKYVYQQLNAEDQLQYAVYPGSHSWDSNRRMKLSEFLADHLDLMPAAEVVNDTSDCLDVSERCWDQPPVDAIEINELAMRLSGKRYPPELQMLDIFPPRRQGDHVDENSLLQGQGKDKHVLAQFEAFLKPTHHR